MRAEESNGVVFGSAKPSYGSGNGRPERGAIETAAQTIIDSGDEYMYADIPHTYAKYVRAVVERYGDREWRAIVRTVGEDTVRFWVVRKGKKVV